MKSWSIYIPKKLYFVQLGGTYGQLGREKDYMITLKAAHAKDFLDKESEYLSFSTIVTIKSESILGCTSSCIWTEKNYYIYRNSKR